jgi:hypothetical protein
MQKGFIVPAVAAAILGGGAQLASAAPPEQETVPLVCDNGDTFTVVVNGNGAFTPAG